MNKIEYGLQLYSVRDVAETDLKAGIRAAAEAGYHYMEFAGFFGNSAEDVKAWMEEYGVEVSGTHTGLDELTKDKIKDTIAFHHAIGCKHLIIPGGLPGSTREKLEMGIAFLNEVQPILNAEGISLSFHNHSGEFIKNSYGAIMHEELQERTAIDFEIDTFWAFIAGVDPIALMNRLKDRIRVIHLRDGIPATETGNNSVVGKALGEGKAPVAAIRQAALDLGIFMVVESGGLDPTGPEEVGRCMRYLRSLEK